MPVDKTPSHVPVPSTILAMDGYSDTSDDAWAGIRGSLNVVIGQNDTRPDLLESFIAQGVLFLEHRTLSLDGPKEDILEGLSEPFRNNYSGKWVDGADGIAIDELSGSMMDGSEEAKKFVDALGELREAFPYKVIWVWAKWNVISGYADYSEILTAVDTYADVLGVERYARELNPQLDLFETYAKNLSPSLRAKSVFGIWMTQSDPFIADDSPYVDYFEFLDEQLHLLRNSDLLRETKGVAFWTFYRAETITVDHVGKLLDHYYWSDSRDYLGRGDDSELVQSPSFESGTDWVLDPGNDGLVDYVTLESEGLPRNHGGTSDHESQCVRMKKENDENWLRQWVNLDLGRSYVFSTYVIGYGSALVTVHAEGKSDRLGELYYDDVQPDKWSKVSVKFTVPLDENVVGLDLRDGNGAPGNLLFWDFAGLVEIDE